MQSAQGLLVLEPFGRLSNRMELVLFIGIQATGKSSFYRERFYRTHVRVSYDMLRTRHREELLLKACIEGKTRFVVDNTVLTRQERARYIAPAKSAGFSVVGYFFQSRVADACVETTSAAKPSACPTKEFSVQADAWNFRRRPRASISCSSSD